MFQRTENKIILAVYSISTLILLTVFIIAIKFEIPFEKITGDPLYTFNANPFTGALSNIGIVFWGIAGSISIFSGFLLRINKEKHKALFLIISGILSFGLLTDDLFMLHDYVFLAPIFGLSQLIIYFVYGIIFTGYIFKYHKLILSNTKYHLLLLSFAFLSLSIALDVLFLNEGIQYFLEDGLKFLGIVSWMLFFSITSFNFLSQKENFKSSEIHY